jgi:hypothetical protein
MNFTNLDDILLHLAGPYNNMVDVGKDYTIQDLIDDLVDIGKENAIVSCSLAKAALSMRDRDEQ